MLSREIGEPRGCYGPSMGSSKDLDDHDNDHDDGRAGMLYHNVVLVIINHFDMAIAGPWSPSKDIYDSSSLANIEAVPRQSPR
jgi:hypothetical protein